MKKTIVTLVLLVGASIPSLGQGSGELEGIIELLRSDVRAEKVALLTAAMQLTEEQAEKFWSLQREYEHELAKISDRRVAQVKKYVETWGTMTDEQAAELAKEYLAIQAERVKLRKATYKRMAREVGSLAAARFLQIEDAIQNLLDLQLSSELPIIR